MFLWTLPALPVAYAARDARRHMLSTSLLRGERRQPREPKVMPRPRVEISTDRHSTIASPIEAMTVSAIGVGSVARHALIWRAHNTHPFTHSRAGFRSCRLALSTWRRTVCQPA